MSIEFEKQLDRSLDFLHSTPAHDKRFENLKGNYQSLIYDNRLQQSPNLTLQKPRSPSPEPKPEINLNTENFLVGKPNLTRLDKGSVLFQSMTKRKPFFEQKSF